MVGMTVREPVIFCFSYRLHLCCGNFVVLGPATEISAVVYPRISCEHGPIVIVRYEDSATDRFEKPHLLAPLANSSLSSRTMTIRCLSDSVQPVRGPAIIADALMYSIHSPG